MTNLLICGSRELLPGMVEYARCCVERARQRDYVVIVGDAGGIDAVVMQECHRLSVPHIIYGANGKLRRRTASASLYICDGDYLARDYEMAQAANLCLGIWNGQSKGTVHTVNYARSLGKQVWLKDFSKVRE